MQTPKQLNVTISMTISKSFTIDVNDYKTDIIGIDEDTFPVKKADFSSCDLKKAVKEQIILPNEAYKCMEVWDSKSADVYEDLSRWSVDDFIVIPND